MIMLFIVLTHNSMDSQYLLKTLKYRHKYKFFTLQDNVGELTFVDDYDDDDDDDMLPYICYLGDLTVNFPILHRFFLYLKNNHANNL